MPQQSQKRCGANWRKPVSQISDRAKRYRANSAGCRPKGRRSCEYCGARENVGTHHRNGDESNNSPRNLAYACKSCNAIIGIEHKNKGKGKRVSQTNPATSLAQYVTALLSAKGESDAIPRSEAIEIIHSTTPTARSSFARQIWKIRKSRRNPAELLIFGNPKKGIGNHKPACSCFMCKRMRAKGAKKNAAPSTKKTKAGSGAKKVVARSNPSDQDQAVRLFEDFSGREASRIIQKQESAAMRMDYAALGDLDYLKVKTPDGEAAMFNFEGDKVKLAGAPNRKQLYLIGGNQNLDGELDATALQKDFVDLGECTEVQYIARKVHISPVPTSYFHKFGEDTGERPRLMYDKLKKRIFFVGGAYKITDRGIEN